MDQDQSTIRLLNSVIDLSLESFEDRLSLQKIVFIAKKMGFNVGYSFNWYHRGPYSPSLTQMLFTAQEDERLNPTGILLSASEEDVSKRLREFLQDDVTNPSHLELLASLWYFIKNPGEVDRDTVIKEIERLKPQYKRRQIESAYDRILAFYETE